MKFKVTSLVILAMIFLNSGCNDDDNATGPGEISGYVTATINHWGYDFSEAKADTTNWGENNDGETIGWSPTDYKAQNGIWYRTRIYPNRTKGMGKINIASVTSIDTTTAAWDTQPAPLSKDDVVVAQCNDGFVKFKVIEIGRAHV